MDVILCSADPDREAAQDVRAATEIGVEFVPERWVTEQWKAVFVEKTVWIYIRDNDWGMAELVVIAGMDATPIGVGIFGWT